MSIPSFLSFTLLLLGLPGARPAFGPPALCFPMDIGKAPSLPFGEDPFRNPFRTDPAFPLAKVVPETLRILREGDDVFVHMETLRRAGVYLMKSRTREEGALRRSQARELLDRLKNRILEAEADPVRLTDRRRALCWFDLGYAAGTLRQASLSFEGPWEACLAKASNMRKKEAEIHLGVALVSFSGNSRNLWRRHLRRALELAGDPEGRVARTALRIFGRLTGKRSQEALRKEMGVKR